VNGKNIGAIRISFGACSTVEDVCAFVDFVREFYVEKDLVQASIDLEKGGDSLRIRMDRRQIQTESLEWKFSWKDISYSVKTKFGKKTILQNVSGCVEKGIPPIFLSNVTGSLLAIMGHSGCGKTTLLDILSRRLTGSSITGQQMIAGSPFDDSTLHALSTYIEQGDHLIGSLTVRETIEFAAKLTLPGTIGPQARRNRTKEMLKDFGLMLVKDMRVGTPLQRGISGGQKRRLSIASQLIGLPQIVFLGTSSV
jgi:ABC-type lipoprotein export system ATPase subunit